MRPDGLTIAFRTWLLFTFIAACLSYSAGVGEGIPLPTSHVQARARIALNKLASNDAVASGEAPCNNKTLNYRALAPINVELWRDGKRVMHYARSRDLAKTLHGAAQAFAHIPRDHTSTTLFIPTHRASIPTWLKPLATMSIAFQVDALQTADDFFTPARLFAEQAFGKIATPLPELRFGVDIDAHRSKISDTHVQRWRGIWLTSTRYPQPRAVSIKELEYAAREGVAFIMRHQRADGVFAYTYDARTDTSNYDTSSLPRQAGTAYYLAYAARYFRDAHIRAAAARALGWIAQNRSARCFDQLCIESSGLADLGANALTLLAASELLRSGDDKTATMLVRQLPAFIYHMQRPDGEVHHFYEVHSGRILDEQSLYYSGEVATALYHVAEHHHQPQAKQAADRVLRFLTHDNWTFFGSRYYYGEEHWTCIAAGCALSKVAGALEFCERWAQFNRATQYQDHETVWPIKGSYGVGPLFPPRITPTASRSEALIAYYRKLRSLHQHDETLKKQIETSLAFLLRHQWLPGPTFAMRDAARARGGLAGSPDGLEVRTDFVQHAGSAMLSYAELIR